MTKHETIATAFLAALTDAALPTLIRDVDLPDDCPAEGLARVEFDSPEEVERRLDGTREYQRVAEVTLIVTDGEATNRITALDALLVQLGTRIAATTIAGVDFLDCGDPEYDEDVDIPAATPASGVTVPVTLFYETGPNPLEE